MNNSGSSSSIEVKVCAIDGDYLVLETLTDKTKILWPLKNIPQPLPISGRLTLELKKENFEETLEETFLPNENNIDIQKQLDKEEKMRKMLEELVN